MWDGWVYVPPPDQKRGLDWRFASERPSNSAPQTPDCLFLAPVGAGKQGQDQFTSNSTTSRGKLQLDIHSISSQYTQTYFCFSKYYILHIQDNDTYVTNLFEIIHTMHLMLDELRESPSSILLNKMEKIVAGLLYI